ncbi:hypothetical protein [Clostridium botulinum]|uniref:hypothetical protein n=1 Tax=Clostridium botulinum TaxID=1491 RepID=UPI00196768F2|nr:hypothetical protein [Clostridium botulinum]MBN1060201.1 hypothetical protein [Clostridium botulinum]
MKRFENSQTWEIALDTLNKFNNTNQFYSELKEDEINIQFHRLSYCNINDKNNTKSEIELRGLENKGEIFNSHLLIRIAKHLYLENAIENKDNVDKITILITLHAYLGNGYYFKVSVDIFNKLYSLGNICPSKYYASFEEQSSIKRVVESALYLKNKGFDFFITESRIETNENLEKSIFEILDKKVSIVGGLNFLQKIINKYISCNYIELIDRFIITRSVDDSRNEPLNLLINLAARHLYTRENNEKNIQIMDEIIRIAQAWLDISDIQGESAIEYASMQYNDFPYYLKNEMIFEKMCIPVQYSKKFILKSLDYLIKPWFDKYAKKQYKYTEYRKVTKYILSMQVCLGTITAVRIKNETHIAMHKVKKILEDIALPSNEVNTEFTCLDGKINFFNKPLIKIPINKYFFIDQHFSGFGFYLVAYDAIKENYKLIDREQGLIVEEILRDEIKKKGFKFSYGNYEKLNNIEGSDCDLVLEGKKICFFEVKKKFAMDEFNSIDDVSMLNSLSAGMIRAQKQAFSHELYLKENKFMKLINESGIEKIEFNEEMLPSIKVSICFPEYAFLTDSIFSRMLLELLMISSFSTRDESRQKKLENLNKYGKEIHDIVEIINEGKLIDAKDVGFLSLFCSLQQILTAIWCCDTKEQFLEILNVWIYSTDKTLNPYISLMYTIHSRNNKSSQSDLHKAMIDFAEKHGNIKVLGGL